MVIDNNELINKALSKDLIIPDFQDFSNDIKEIYDACLKNHGGKNADYIPQLARQSSDQWAVSVCTVDGQRYSIGDTETAFTMQSTSKPLVY